LSPTPLVSPPTVCRLGSPTSAVTNNAWTYNQVLPQVGAHGDLRALVGKLPCLGLVPAGQPEISQTGEEVGRVAPPIPVAGRRIICEAVDSVEELLGQHEVALGQENVTEVDLGIGNRLRVTPLPSPFGSMPVEVEGLIQVSKLHVEPPKAVEETLAIDFVAHLIPSRVFGVDAFLFEVFQIIII
jgi:hypothetical protein